MMYQEIAETIKCSDLLDGYEDIAHEGISELGCLTLLCPNQQVILMNDYKPKTSSARASPISMIGGSPLQNQLKPLLRKIPQLCKSGYNAAINGGSINKIKLCGESPKKRQKQKGQQDLTSTSVSGCFSSPRSLSSSRCCSSNSINSMSTGIESSCEEPIHYYHCDIDDVAITLRKSEVTFCMEEKIDEIKNIKQTNNHSAINSPFSMSPSTSDNKLYTNNRCTSPFVTSCITESINTNSNTKDINIHNITNNTCREETFDLCTLSSRISLSDTNSTVDVYIQGDIPTGGGSRVSPVSNSTTDRTTCLECRDDITSNEDKVEKTEWDLLPRYEKEHDVGLLPSYIDRISLIDCGRVTNLSAGLLHHKWHSHTNEYKFMSRILLGKWETVLARSNPLDPLFKSFYISYIKRVVLDRLAIPVTLTLENKEEVLDMQIHLPMGHRHMRWSLDGSTTTEEDPDCGTWTGYVRCQEIVLPWACDGRPFRGLQQVRTHRKIGEVHETRAVLPDDKYGKILYLSYTLFPKSNPSNRLDIVRILKPIK